MCVKHEQTSALNACTRCTVGPQEYHRSHFADAAPKPARHSPPPNPLSARSLYTQVTLSRRRTYSNVTRGHLLVIDFLLFSETKRRDSAKASSQSSRVIGILLRPTSALTELQRFRSKVLSEMTTNVTVFWDMVPRTLSNR